MGLEKTIEPKLNELKEKHSREENSLFYLFNHFRKDYEKIKKAYENEFKEGEFSDEKLFDKFYNSINKILNDYLQNFRTHNPNNKETPETKLGLISLEEISSSDFADQSFAYKENLTDYAKYILTEYTMIKEAKTLGDFKAKGKITVVSQI
jgi:hypothetical protein